MSDDRACLPNGLESVSQEESEGFDLNDLVDGMIVDGTRDCFLHGCPRFPAGNLG